MYIRIGAFDAKTKLSRLLQSVRRGQRYTITLRGKPVADLTPSESHGVPDVRTAVEAMRSIRKVRGIEAETIVDWIVQGRR